MPPTRRSFFEWNVLTPFGLNHCASRSSSVHAFHIRSRGASNVRDITNSNPFDNSSPRRARVWWRPSSAPHLPDELAGSVEHAAGGDLARGGVVTFYDGGHFSSPFSSDW